MAQPSITVIYNGDCPICRREIDMYRRLQDRTAPDDRRAEIDWRDLTQDPDILDAWSLTEDQGARRLHVVDETNTLLSGVDAFARLWLALPGFGWLGRLTRLPFVRPVAYAIYEGVLAPFLFWLRKRRVKRRNNGSGQ